MNYPPNNTSKKQLALEPKTTKVALKEANQMLVDSINGDHKVLRTRWGKINTMLLGGFHFGQIYFLCGASGHGKSYFLNMIQRDFLNKRLNNPKFSFKMLHFGFEMSSSIEMLRRIASMTKIPFRKLIASDDPLTEEEFKKIQNSYRSIQDEPMFFFEDPGTRLQIEKTIQTMALRFPNDKLIITLDHSLLVINERGEDEIQTLSELGKLFIRLKKQHGLMVICLGQLNDKIESEKRRDPTNPTLHFPTKTDIHGSKQLYHASDVVMVIHQPALLNLETYGRHHFPTKNLVAIHMLKQRNGQQGFTLMKNNLKHGEILEMDKDEAKGRKKSTLSEVKDSLVAKQTSN